MTWVRYKCACAFGLLSFVSATCHEKNLPYEVTGPRRIKDTWDKPKSNSLPGAKPSQPAAESRASLASSHHHELKMHPFVVVSHQDLRAICYTALLSKNLTIPLLVLQMKSFTDCDIGLDSFWSHFFPSVKCECHTCLILLLCMCAQLCRTLWDLMECSLGSPAHGDSPGKNTRVDCHFVLQGIFPTQGSNPGLLHGRQILYHLSHREVHVCLIFIDKGRRYLIPAPGGWSDFTPQLVKGGGDTAINKDPSSCRVWST